MSYKLTLTRSERQAIEWIGHRYFHGNDLQDLISTFTPYDADDMLIAAENTITSVPVDEAWESNHDITFDLPECVAWRINEGFEAEGYQFACLAEDFAAKLQNFVDSIV